MEDLSKKTDEELERIREDSADNAYVPSSVYHKAERELERRHKKRIEDGLKRPTTVGILNQGENSKFVGNTFEGFDVGIKDEGKNTLAEGNKFINFIQMKKNYWEIGGVLVGLFLLVWGVFTYFVPSSVSNNDANNEFNISTSSPIQITDILNGYTAQSNSLNRESFLSKYKDAQVFGKGSFTDIGKNPDSFIVIITISRYFIFRDSIMCDFSSDWDRQLNLLKIGQKIKFSGVFSGFKDSPSNAFFVANCSFLEK